MANKIVVMIGPAFCAKGGIASVVRTYRDWGLFRDHPFFYLATYTNTSLLLSGYFLLRALFTFILLCVSFRVKSLHVHSASRGSFWRKSLFIFIAFFFRIYVVFQLHGGEFDKFYYNECGYFRKKIIKFVLERVDKIVVLSRVWFEFIGSIFNNNEISIIPNPIFPVKIVPDFLRKNRNSILFVGRICKQKGIFDLLESVSVLKKTLPDINLIVAGDGDVQTLEQKIFELDISKEVSYVGWVDGFKKQELYESAAVFVLPSYAETFGLANVEAMSHGLPVISTDVGGIRDVIQNNVSGIMIAPGDISALCQKILLVLTDDLLRRRLGEGGYSRVVSTFSCDVVMPMVVNIH